MNRYIPTRSYFSNCNSSKSTKLQANTQGIYQSTCTVFVKPNFVLISIKLINQPKWPPVYTCKVESSFIIFFLPFSFIGKYLKFYLVRDNNNKNAVTYVRFADFLLQVNRLNLLVKYTTLHVSLLSTLVYIWLYNIIKKNKNTKIDNVFTEKTILLKDEQPVGMLIGRPSHVLFYML